MGIRELAGDMARNTSGVWRGIADAVDPGGRPSRDQRPVAPVAGPEPAGGDGFEEQSGRMIVPVDTWTRILEQVGHVHEAGQQLADAKERAARAETENRFLHEQLKELKTQRRPARRAAPKPAATPAPVADAAAPVPESREPRSTRVRRRMSAWLSP